VTTGVIRRRPYPSILTTVSNRLGSLAGLIRHVRARLGEEHIVQLEGAAAVANVGDKHGRKAAEVALGRGASSDGDGSAVHVHLTVANVVEPGPGEDGIAGRSIRGDSEGVGALAGGGAVSDVRVDDVPGAASVVGERGLTAATAVVGTTVDGEALRRASSPLSSRLALRRTEEGVVTLAGEVVAARAQRASHAVVDVASGIGVVLGLEGSGRGHLHVGVRHGNQAKEGGESLSSLHGEGCGDEVVR
jgi:hypothetical protein